jgi:ArsR family transcriptional regulator, cadmium/lead-responsive transcriptional repressor
MVPVPNAPDATGRILPGPCHSPVPRGQDTIDRYHRCVAMTSGGRDSACSADLAQAAALFRSLGDVTRLAIVHELARGERRVVDLTRVLGLAQSTVSAHVACLRGCGLVKGRAVGRQMLYRLSQPQLPALLGSAELLLVATGNAVEPCPVRGHGGRETEQEHPA